MDGAGEEQPEERAAGALGMGCGKGMDEGRGMSDAGSR